jgi:RimJ/RimL family protein N-acetyltransferase
MSNNLSYLMKLSFSPIEESDAQEIVGWRYLPPYHIYNLENTVESIQYALNPHYNYHAMRDENAQLVGFCSFGIDGQVPGGDYSADALDIGMGIHPDLTGRGLGASYVVAVLEFAERKFQPNAFRVTIAAFNRRAQRVWHKNGFKPVQRFTHPASKLDFIVMTRGVKPPKTIVPSQK